MKVDECISTMDWKNLRSYLQYRFNVEARERSIDNGKPKARKKSKGAVSQSDGEEDWRTEVKTLEDFEICAAPATVASDLAREIDRYYAWNEYDKATPPQEGVQSFRRGYDCVNITTTPVVSRTKSFRVTVRMCFYQEPEDAEKERKL